MEITNVAGSIQVKSDPADVSPEYIKVSKITNISCVFVDLAAITDPQANSIQATYPFPVIAKVLIELQHDRKFEFDVQDVTNQGTWLATEAGLGVAKADINAFT